MKKIILCLVGIIFAGFSEFVSAEDDMMMLIDRMAKVSRQYNGRTICSEGGRRTLGDLAKALDEYTEAHLSWRGKNNVSDKDIYLSQIRYFPCPFNPRLAPVKHAVNGDLTGHWELVPASLKIKINLFERDPFPSNCEYFAFSEDGDMRSFQMITTDTCPSVAASDFEKIKALPKVIDWRLGSDGMLKITRTDIPNYIELWDAFVVTSSFSQAGVMFEPGDLLLFMDQFMQKKREEIGTLYFRQFRKIAGK